MKNWYIEVVHRRSVIGDLTSFSKQDKGKLLVCRGILLILGINDLWKLEEGRESIDWGLNADESFVWALNDLIIENRWFEFFNRSDFFYLSLSMLIDEWILINKINSNPLSKDCKLFCSFHVWTVCTLITTIFELGCSLCLQASRLCS